MPEGDTIHNLARRIAPSLVGKPLEALLMRHRGENERLRGAIVQSVEALGKHLLIALDLPRSSSGERGRRWVLRLHLGMRGRLRQLAAREGWRERERGADVAIAAGGAIHVGYRVAQVELFPRDRLALHPQLAHLGPDLLGPEPDFDRVLRRARARGHRPIAEVLLDQRVACGLGNVYKSELCHLTAVHPRTPTGALDDVTLGSIYRLGRQLLLRNQDQPFRVTRPTAGLPHEPEKRLRLWVYNRAGRPCYTCGAPILSTRLGDDARSTFWCPSCQPPKPLRSG